MNDEEWNAIQNQQFICVDNVKGKQQLIDFSLQLQRVYDMHDFPQIKFYLIPDYEDGKSAIIFKIYHCMTDGLGMASLLQVFNGKYDSSAMPKMRPITPAFWGVCFLLSPLFIAWVGIKNIIFNTEVNSLKKLEPLTGVKKSGFASSFDLKKMKVYCK
jgi:hypothetical protein